MKFKNIIFFSLIFVFLSSLSFGVLAQQYYSSTDITQDIVDFFNDAVNWLFGTTSIDLLIYLSVAVILAIMFSDALITFSPMSRGASIAVGILLSFVLILLGIVQAVVTGLLVITAVFGSFAMVASIFFVFVAYVIFHFGILRLLWWIKNPTAANIDTVKKGIEGLRKIGEEFKKSKRRKL